MPTDVELHGGEECPPGYYCPEGTGEPIPCPAGSYRDITLGKSVDDCILCPSGRFNDLEGQAGCFSCGPNAGSDEGSITCDCDGKNRAYMKRDATCRCIPQYNYYMDATEESDRDSDFDCIPIVYPICGDEEFYNYLGECVEKDDCEDFCFGEEGTQSPGVGLCNCENVTTYNDVCNQNCRDSTTVVTLENSGLFAMYNPTTNVITYTDF